MIFCNRAAAAIVYNVFKFAPNLIKPPASLPLFR